MFFIPAAHAQGAAPAPGGDPMISFAFMIGIFVLFYFIAIRPQRKRQKEHQDMVSKLAVKDEVATASGIPHESDRLVGITRDDPYVVDEDHIRFDAALLVAGPVNPPRPFTYHAMSAQLCVVHRHTGGAEQIAKTFAAIGVQWMPSEGWRLRCASPFEVHHVDQAVTGAARISHTHAYVPLEHRHHTHPEGAP